ncbi:hypothetical protein GCM10023347_47600 [Streptomyces chumphonensis]|uniref:Uncharacterized protein n=1 Tax=Streptomyces chumphonensis TaxID=1214925 RepID=A0A927F0U3_9ACTN|nr:hypothetical protein [Streptomyces chumphonensis]MBD3932930.1 hypothetical protein [Streptomyces chumphonensis]
MQSSPLALAGRQEARFRAALRLHDATPERPGRWIGLVALAFTLVQLVLVVPGLGLGWDETVYLSQVGPDATTAYFSAPRARGVSFLVAPVAALTSSVLAVRIYLAVLSGAALFLALWVWRGLLPAPVLALAGGLFSSLWITLFYGPQIMPNLWVAFAALATVGCFLRAARDGRHRDPWAFAGVGFGIACVALLRPGDAAWLGLPLVAAALYVRAWRRPLLLAVLALGALLGAAPWLVEAQLHYGGVLTRLERAGEIQGGLGWSLAFDDQAKALVGRSLCRPCTIGWEHPVTAVWWLLLPLPVIAGVVAAVRVRRLAPVLMATLAGLSLAVPYLLLIDYAAPRFLLPAYALLALPVALCLHRLFRARTPWRPAIVLVVVLGLVGHVAVQAAVLRDAVRRSGAAAGAVADVADELNRLGVRPPCVVSGHDAVRVAYRAGCDSRQVGGHDGSITARGLVAAADRRPVAVLVAGDERPPAYARDWPEHALPDWSSSRNYRAYLAP